MNKLTNYIIEVVTDILLIGMAVITFNLYISLNNLQKQVEVIKDRQQQTEWVKTQIELNHNENKSINH